LYALSTLHSLVQNCDRPVRAELSSRLVGDALFSLLQSGRAHPAVKAKALSCLQAWVSEHGQDPTFAYLVSLRQRLAALGHRFPETGWQGPLPVPPAPGAARRTKAEEEKEEEEDMQLALALSLSQQEQGHSPASPHHPASGPSRPFHCRALYDFPGADEGELPLVKGAILLVTDHTSFSPWWKGQADSGALGIFPSNYVEPLAEPDNVPAPGSVAQQSRDRALALLREISNGNIHAPATANLSKVGHLHRELMSSHSALKDQIDGATAQHGRDSSEGQQGCPPSNTTLAHPWPHARPAATLRDLLARYNRAQQLADRLLNARSFTNTFNPPARTYY
jgi:hypothetical protein